MLVLTMILTVYIVPKPAVLMHISGINFMYVCAFYVAYAINRNPTYKKSFAFAATNYICMIDIYQAPWL